MYLTGHAEESMSGTHQRPTRSSAGVRWSFTPLFETSAVLALDLMWRLAYTNMNRLGPNRALLGKSCVALMCVEKNGVVGAAESPTFRVIHTSFCKLALQSNSLEYALQTFCASGVETVGVIR